MAEQLQRIVVDLETTGLNPDTDIAVEVAWWCLETGEQDRFVPPHEDFDMTAAAPEALRKNSYYDRGLDNPNGWDRDGSALRRLHAVLVGQTWTGANPRFDVTFTRPLFVTAGLNPEPFHHRLLDIEATARAVLGWAAMPGMREICTALGMEPGDHTAAGDVAAEGWALLELDQRRAALLAPLPASAVILDAAVDADHRRLTRAVLRIPDGVTLTATDKALGRRVLQILANGAHA